MYRGKIPAGHLLPNGARVLGEGHVDRTVVHIQPDKHVTFPHDRPPRVWRCAPFRDAPQNPRDDEDGRSLSFLVGLSEVRANNPPPSRPPATEGPASAYEKSFEGLSSQFAVDALALLGVKPGERVLDVAAGTGTFSLLAARRSSAGAIPEIFS
jgi:hypothetical protein